jgi:AcrR family transcriptional regulator
VDAAREQLALTGPAGLSLRAVARELGMAPSALYRYFASRDDLLTRLIIDAYEALGAAAERAEGSVPRDRPADRFRAVGATVRTWALAHPHEYALVYGTPVPGYRAPRDTVGPATRVAALLVGILADAVASGDADAGWADLPTPLADDLAPAVRFFAAAGEVPDELVLRGLLAWSSILGAVSFELFGHLHDVVRSEKQADSRFFDAELDRLLRLLSIRG